MPEDEDLQDRDPFAPEPSESANDSRIAIAAIIAAITSGFTIRAVELLHLARDTGTATIPVRSSCIAEITYNVATGTMGIVFTDGSTYDYPDMSIVSVLQFINAPSHGAYYNQHLRGQAATQFAGSKKQRIRLGR